MDNNVVANISIKKLDSLKANFCYVSYKTPFFGLCISTIQFCKSEFNIEDIAFVQFCSAVRTVIVPMGCCKPGSLKYFPKSSRFSLRDMQNREGTCCSCVTTTPWVF